MATSLKPIRDGALFLAVVGLSLLAIARLEQRDPVFVSGEFFVIDGDTLALDGQRLRLAGIDAPELHQDCRLPDGVWTCGEDARRMLAGLMAPAGMARCSGLREDRYGRRLVDCVRGTLNINAEMVARGMAVAYGGFSAEEQTARAARRGIWAGPMERPEDWRRRQASPQEGAIRRDWLHQALGWIGWRD